MVELQFVDAVEGRAWIDRLVQLRERGEDDRRHMVVVGESLGHKGVESVAAAEEQRAIARPKVGSAVEVVSLESMTGIEVLQLTGERFEPGQAPIRAEPEISQAISEDAVDDRARQALPIAVLTERTAVGEAIGSLPTV